MLRDQSNQVKVIAVGRGSHIISSLRGKGQAPLKDCAATESANDTGYR
jgi:hypothetical protein